MQERPSRLTETILFQMKAIYGEAKLAFAWEKEFSILTNQLGRVWQLHAASQPKRFCVQCILFSLLGYLRRHCQVSTGVVHTVVVSPRRLSFGIVSVGLERRDESSVAALPSRNLKFYFIFISTRQ